MTGNEETEHSSNIGERLTIHGVRDVLESKTIFERNLWFILIVLSVTGMTYELTRVFRAYCDEKTASLVSLTFPVEFPDIVLCPRQYVNVSRAREVGVTPEMFHLLRMLFFWMPDYQPEINMENTTAVSDSLQSLVSVYGSVDALLYDISYKAVEISNYTAWKQEYNYNNTMGKDREPSGAAFLTSTLGMCYKFTVGRIFDELSVLDAWLVFSYSIYGDYEEFSHDFDYFANYMYLGENGDSIRPLADTFLELDSHYMVKLSYRHSIRQDLSRMPCAQWKPRDRMDCLYDCRLRLCEEEDRCLPFVPDRNMSNLAGICTWTRPDEQCLQKEIEKRSAELCVPDCPPGCESKIYRATLVPHGSMRPNHSTSYLYLSFSDPIHSELIKETLIYDGINLLANIGGVISLWCGASILSLLQLIQYFAIRPLAARFNGKEKEESGDVVFVKRF